MLIETRICKNCGEKKPLHAGFFGHTSAGFRGECRLCKNARERRYDAANPEQVRAKWQRQNLKRSLAGPVWDLAEIVSIRSFLKDKCVYCSTVLGGGGEVDHMQSLEHNGTNALSNLTLACMPCNRAKGKRNAEEFLIYRTLHNLTIRKDARKLLLGWKKRANAMRPNSN
jgi:5-methylcytosine-specific restriction endonuclease McrA